MPDSEPTNGQSPQTNPSGVAVPERGLPPVAPPSGRFILQLFLVPGLIVAVAVLVLLGFNWLMGSRRTPADYLKKLDDEDADVRWRAAADLSQFLLRDENLASNVNFSLELTRRLQRAVRDIALREQARLERVRKNGGDAPDPELKPLEKERKYIMFLTAALGHFRVPSAAPVLAELAVSDSGVEPETLFHRRAQALWALTNLGASLNKFDQLPEARRSSIVAQVQAEAGGEDAELAGWAKQALELLQNRQPGQSSLAARRIGDALVRCAAAEAPFLRIETAHALSFWDAAGNAAEDTLVRLAQDDGRGDNPVRRPADQQQYYKDNAVALREKNRNLVRYNATMSLLRRGSPRIKEFFSVVEEMLDEKKQLEVWKFGEPDRKTPPQAEARELLLLTLRTLIQTREKYPTLDLRSLKPTIDRLAGSDIVAIATEARQLQLLLNR